MKAIIAVNKKGVIGNGDFMPWRCSADLKHFKALTLNSVCLVGRKTFDSLPPLTDRTLVVVGKNQNSLDEALEQNIDWIIGGKSIYEQTLHLCDELHISIINDYSDGDVKCPDLSKFEGKIFIYNFDPNLPKIGETKLGEIMKQSEIVKDAMIWLKTETKELKKKGPSEVCKHEVFEQKLIEGGMSPEQAKIQIRFIACSCPKCIDKF